MSVGVFVDTNVLIYARDRRDPAKRDRAAQWLAALGAAGAGQVNLQVIQEFTRWMLAHERHRPLSDLREEADLLMAWGHNPISLEEIDFAWAIRGSIGYQWFDCLLLAAAAQLGCTYFLSEDMSPGVTVGPTTIISPFDRLPADILPAH